jgi:hypothetical protein
MAWRKLVNKLWLSEKGRVEAYETRDGVQKEDNNTHGAYGRKYCAA